MASTTATVEKKAAINAFASSKGLLALLTETDAEILRYAVTRLLEVVDAYWFEIAAELTLLDELHESVSLTEDIRNLFALLISRVFFHLSEYHESVNYALAAGPAFRGDDKSLFTVTILGRCIDIYVTARQSLEQGTAESEGHGEAAENISGEIDPRLEALFNGLAESWQSDEGFAVSAKELVGFFIRARRADLLERVLLKDISRTRNSDLISHTLVLVDTQVSNMEFRREVLLLLAKLYREGMDHVDYISLSRCLLLLDDDEGLARLLLSLLTTDRLMAYQLGFDLYDYSNTYFIKRVLERLTSQTEAAVDEKLLSIINGEVSTKLYLTFLYNRVAADVGILNEAKKSSYKGVGQCATVLGNAMVYGGTTIDGFLRADMNWLGKFKQWNKFMVTASLGCLHIGHAEEAMNVLGQYLPDANNMGELPHSEAGSLYALGLIAATSALPRAPAVVTYLSEQLSQFAANPIMVHGAALGLGLAAMSTNDEQLTDRLFAHVTGDTSAVGGEAAAIAMGLVNLGSCNSGLLTMLLNHTKDCQKERIIRGLSIAMALVLLRRRSEADATVAQMLQSDDQWVRLGACQALGLAYAGTGDTYALRRLLQVGVRDTSPDVRRAAIIMIGFVCFRDAAQCVEMVRTLQGSYNPHLRYATALAVAIASCGNPEPEVVKLLMGLREDTESFVRQGAFIALSLVLVQASEKDVPEVKTVRDQLLSIIPKNDSCLNFGAIMALSLLDFGGRNATLMLQKGGKPLDKAIIGLFMFAQYWYWFPFTLMLPLAMQPTCIIALNEQLEMPEFSLLSKAPASRFAPPKSLHEVRKETRTKSKKLVALSRDSKKGRRAGSSAKEEEIGAKAKPAEEPSPEAPTETLVNPMRVARRQLQVVEELEGARYRLLKPPSLGIVLVRDTCPDGDQKLAVVRPEGDVAPPEAFDFFD